MITAMRAFLFLLHLYPRRQRDEFGPEMAAVFEQAMNASRNRGRLPLIRFLFLEMAGLIAGAAREWTERPSTTPQEDSEPGGYRLPEEVLAVQLRVDAAIQKMVYAISHHQFEEARRFSNEERRERESLRRLQNKYGII
jgi:hypothetical protein